MREGQKKNMMINKSNRGRDKNIDEEQWGTDANSATSEYGELTAREEARTAFMYMRGQARVS